MEDYGISESLKSFRQELGDVIEVYHRRGDNGGRPRFDSWARRVLAFLKESLPGATATFKTYMTVISFGRRINEDDREQFVREYANPIFGFIDSLLQDIREGHHQWALTPPGRSGSPGNRFDSEKVFIVHGHDGETKQAVARFIEQLGFTAVILHEQPSKGLTIIEKIEQFTDVGFGIVLYTADDVGAAKASIDNLRPRARQNVVFEHGFLVAKLGRARVTPVVEDSVEIPSDISGVVYIAKSDWKFKLAQELKEAGYEIDSAKLLARV